MPGPGRRRRCLASRTVTSIGAPDGSNLVALSSRHDSARCTAARWATTGERSATTTIVAPGPALVPADDVGRQLGQVENSVAGSSTTSPTGDGDDLVDELGQLFDLGVDVGDHASRSAGRQVGVAAQHVEVGADAGERRPQLVARRPARAVAAVRCELASAPSMRSKAELRRPTSSSPALPTGASSRPVVPTCSAAAVNRRSGPVTLLAINDSDRGGDRRRRSTTNAIVRARSAQDALRLVQRPGHLERTARDARPCGPDSRRRRP